MNKRQSNFEILRIVSIVMIMIFHNIWKAGFDLSPGGAITVNRIICDIIAHFGEIGVNCFVLISGYFAPDTKFKWKKAILYICSVLFYASFNKVLQVYYGLATFDHWKLRDWLFPLYRNFFWFCTAYFFLYMITPYIKKLIGVLSKKEFGTLILSQLLIWSIMPTFVLCMIYKSGNAEGISYYNRYIWMVVVYLVGAYIRLYGLPFFTSLRKSIAVLIFLWAALMFFIIGTEYRIFPWKELSQIYFWPPNTIPVLAISVAMLMIFKYIKVPYIEPVNLVASCTMGIYMFHDGKLQKYYWCQFTHTVQHYESPFFILWVIGAVALVFIMALGTELTRKMIERVTLIPLIDFTDKHMKAIWGGAKRKIDLQKDKIHRKKVRRNKSKRKK